MQEEDEHWISEEELYTEGSSDEEKGTHSSRRRRERDTRRSHATSSSSSRSEKSHSPAPEFKPLEEDITGTDPSDLASCSYSEVEPDDIVWRPKRGSIKLPDIEVSDFSQPSTSGVK